MKLATFVAAAVMALTGAGVAAQQVTFDFDRTADFFAYRTYAWAHGTPVPDPLIDGRILSAIERQLAAKGLKKATSTRPDVLISYHAAAERDLQITAFGSGYGFPAARSGTARAEQVLVGTLVVTMVDATTERLVWRSAATRDIDVDAKPDKRDKNIARAAEKMFSPYPPK